MIHINLFNKNTLKLLGIGAVAIFVIYKLKGSFLKNTDILKELKDLVKPNANPQGHLPKGLEGLKDIN